MINREYYICTCTTLFFYNLVHNAITRKKIWSPNQERLVLDLSFDTGSRIIFNLLSIWFHLSLNSAYLFQWYLTVSVTVDLDSVVV